MKLRNINKNKRKVHERNIQILQFTLNRSLIPGLEAIAFLTRKLQLQEVLDQLRRRLVEHYYNYFTDMYFGFRTEYIQLVPVLWNMIAAHILLSHFSIM
jgi:hypothetical protein